MDGEKYAIKKVRPFYCARINQPVRFKAESDLCDSKHITVAYELIENTVNYRYVGLIRDDGIWGMLDRIDVGTRVI